MYTKTDLVFGFPKNQILVAVILGQNCFWIIAENHFEMSIICELRFEMQITDGKKSEMGKMENERMPRA